MKQFKVTVVVTIEAEDKNSADAKVHGILVVPEIVKNVEITYVREVKEKQDGQ